MEWSWKEDKEFIDDLGLEKINSAGERWELGEDQSQEALIVAQAISRADSLDGGFLDFEFGGDGDNGEVLIYIIDMLIEVGLITVNLRKE